MKKWNVWLSVAAAVSAVMLAAAPAYAQETALPEGVYIGDISLGGLTGEEARQEVQAYVDHMAGRRVVLELEDRTADTTAQELGFAWTNPEVVEEAQGYAATGNLVQRYMALKDLEKEPVHLPLELSVDQEQVRVFLAAQCEGLPGEPQDASITREDGAFVITPGTEGVVVDAEATEAALNEALKDPEAETVTVKAAVSVAQPRITEEALGTIQDVLGTFSTDFSSSSTARAKNLQVGSSKLNGHVLMPGETLSGYEWMHPFTTENGYYTAAAYENGQVVDSVGGGVCQIATTLYNAALQAELEITQRQNHSMVVGYVKPSMDAAIAGTYKDIKITNNYSTPIYVEGGTSGKTLTFTIYGKETRPANRQVTFESKTLSVTDPGAPTERLDVSMAPGTRRQVQSAHKGIKSELWKIVTVDGVETERTLLNSDTYTASKAVVLVGSAAETQAAAGRAAGASAQEATVPVMEIPEDGVPLAAWPETTAGRPGGDQVVVITEDDAGPAMNQQGPSSTSEAAQSSEPEAASSFATEAEQSALAGAVEVPAAEEAGEPAAEGAGT